MGDPSDSDSGSNSAMISFTGKMLMVGVILFFFVAGFVLFLQLYAKWFWYSQEEEDQQGQNSGNRTATRRRRRLDFSPGHNELASAVFPRQKRSLDPSILKSLPVVAYDSKDFKEALECAVCLSDLAGGEKLRLLPKCNHGFHLECIDMWFQSHSTCPLCRSAVSSSTNIVTSESNSLETILGLPIGDIPDDGPHFPTNVLFCGDETRIITLGLSMEDTSYSHSPPPSSSSAAGMGCNNRADGMVVMDIPPRQGNDDEGPKSPLTTRLRSLKRLLSRDSKERRSNPSSSGSVETEQGNRGQS